MKFGPVPVAKAGGAVLAHGLRLGEVTLRKGRELGAGDIARLVEAGVETVVVARLEAGDIGEDPAATRIAAALCGTGLRMTEAATGRVNLYATEPGFLDLDAAAISALNQVDPMISFATLRPKAQVAAGTLVGTVKIISYGVSERNVDAGVTIADGALAVRPVRAKTAVLIETVLPGAGPGKGADAVQARLSKLGIDMIGVSVVPHAPASLAEALGQISADMALMLTASATSDAADVAPAALKLAGGTVTRFGLPIDPGNLLFYGKLDAMDVIGLPGCARSPTLNGADFILTRLAAGHVPDDAEIAEMGVGGLLKEIPIRPRPRES